MKKLYTIFLSILLFVSFAFGQENDLKRGIALYEKGDYQGAVEVLRSGKEPAYLYYLGLAYEKLDEKGKAKDAFKDAFSKSYDHFYEKFDEWHQVDKGTERRKNLSELLKETNAANAIGAISAQKAFQIDSDIFQRGEWRVKAKVLLDAVEMAKNGEPVYSSSADGLSKIKATGKSRVEFPGVPYSGRGSKAAFFAVLGSDGNMKLLVPLTEKIDDFVAAWFYVNAERKFEPATKEGKPVAVHLMIETEIS